MEGDDGGGVDDLRRALAEMQDSTVSPARMQQIEAELTAFKEAPDSWRQCVAFIKMTDDPDVVWFSHAVFEYTVSVRWATVDEEEKGHLREFIYMCIKDQDKSMLSHVSNKIYTVYAALGKQDWPTSFPNFFELILEMLDSDRETILVGMQLLKVVLEECVSRHGVSARRSEELITLVSSQVPAVFSALETILQATYEGAAIEAGKRALEKRLPTNLGVPPTPRGSPIVFDHVVDDDCGAGPADISEPDLFFQFGAEAEQRVVVAFSCLGQLFGWVNLAEVVSPDLLDILGVYARLSHSACAPAGALAVGCFNEMLSSHGVPITFEEALLKLFEHMVGLLEKVTKPMSDTEKNPLDEIDPEYNTKLTDFLGLFITKHFRRVEASPQFEILDFLMLLFRFTFLQTESEHFVLCLEVCLAFVDVLVVKQEQVGPESIVMYRECVLMLATEVIDRIRFSQNFGALEKIDDAERNIDGLTEWDEHIRDCTAILGQISTLYAADLVESAAPLYITDMEAYVGIGEYLRTRADGTMELSFPDDDTQQGMYAVCRDLRTMTQLMGKLAHHFTEGDIMAHMPEAFELVKSLVELLQFSEENKLYTFGHTFSAVHAELAGALTTFALWFSRAMRSFCGEPVESQRLRELTEVVVTCACTIFQESLGDDAVVLELAAAQLLGRFCTVVRPEFLLEIPNFVALLTEAPVVLSRLLGQARSVLTVALSHAIVLPWHDVADDKQAWESREQKFADFFGRIYSPLADGTAPDADWVISACCSLADVVRSVRDQPKAVQSIVAKALLPIIPVLLNLFESCGSNVAIVASVLDLQLAIFESIAPLLGEDFMRMSISVFVDFFSKETMRSLADGDDAGAMVVETFFKLLQVVVRGRGPLFRRFFADILNLIVNSVVSLLDGDGAGVQVQLALFEVLRYVLLDNWRTFYPSPLRPDGDGEGVEIQNSDELLVILQALLASFNNAEIEPFKHNLETLVMVNTQKKLFSKIFFREHIYIDLLSSLLGVMVAKTHALLEDEICDTLFELAQSDWSAFYTLALPTVLASIDGVDDAHREELTSRFKQVDDKPSFIERLQDFCSDIAHFQQDAHPLFT